MDISIGLGKIKHSSQTLQVSLSQMGIFVIADACELCGYGFGNRGITILAL
jgi:hypothetical protein